MFIDDDAIAHLAPGGLARAANLRSTSLRERMNHTSCGAFARVITLHHSLQLEKCSCPNISRLQPIILSMLRKQVITDDTGIPVGVLLPYEEYLELRALLPLIRASNGNVAESVSQPPVHHQIADEIEALVNSAARGSNMDPEALRADWYENVVMPANPQLTHAQFLSANAHFRKHAKRVDVAQAVGVDNDQIDLDLARAYANKID